MYTIIRLRKLATLYLTAFIGLTIYLLTVRIAIASPPVPDTEPDPMIPEIFEEPVLPENPTQIEFGASIYFYHCMPCHGDRGQGLTDEFRQQWVPDHQNCWASGCHTGRIEDEGFPIPKEVPELLTLASFPKPEQLFSYLKLTHPPQNPGGLTDAEYWSVTAHLLYNAGKASAGIQLGQVSPHAEQATISSDNQPQNPEFGSLGTDSSSSKISSRYSPWVFIITLMTVILFVGLALVWQSRHGRVI